MIMYMNWVRQTVDFSRCRVDIQFRFGLFHKKRWYMLEFPIFSLFLTDHKSLSAPLCNLLPLNFLRCLELEIGCKRKQYLGCTMEGVCTEISLNEFFFKDEKSGQWSQYLDLVFCRTFCLQHLSWRVVLWSLSNIPTGWVNTSQQFWTWHIIFFLILFLFTGHWILFLVTNNIVFLIYCCCLITELFFFFPRTIYIRQSDSFTSKLACCVISMANRLQLTMKSSQYVYKCAAALDTGGRWFRCIRVLCTSDV